MHMEGPWLSTTSTRKRAEKLTKAKQEEVERDWRSRNKWLTDLRLPKQTFEQYLDWLYGRGEKSTTETKHNTKYSKTTTTAFVKVKPKANIVQNTHDKDNIGVEKVIGQMVSADAAGDVAPRKKLWVTGACASKPSPTYTGTKMIGIGQLHKSNAVPVFSTDEAIEISKMRR